MGNRVLRQVVAFSIGLVGVGGLLFWISSSDIQRIKEQHTPIVEVRYLSASCYYQPTDACKESNKLLQNGKYTENLKKDALSDKEVKEIKSLIKNTDFSQLNPSDGKQCNSATGGKDLTFSFPNTDDPTLYTVCHYTNSNKLFDTLKKDLDLPNL